jgi:hypothetical protein
MTTFSLEQIKIVIERANIFLNSCKQSNGYSLTPNAEVTPFSNCFAIFLNYLINKNSSKKINFNAYGEILVSDLYEYKKNREKIVQLNNDKNFLQLLAFTLSALHLINATEKYTLKDIVSELIPEDIESFLYENKIYKGLATTGNVAMCSAIILIYANKFLNINCDDKLEKWIKTHLKYSNKYGLWGREDASHLLFQQGYHQFEIFEYLNIKISKIEDTVSLINYIADERGQFAPYYGGGGCYDYDAVFILTFMNRELAQEDINLLLKTSSTILNEQNNDGGFSDSQWIRPRTINTLKKSLTHVFNNKHLFYERMRYFISLQRPKHNRYKTHWSRYSRNWNESNLWDTWFRLLTIARIDHSVVKSGFNWGFIDFPGIGFHNSKNKLSK